MQSLDSQKYGLALHTTSPQLGLAINNFAHDHRCQTWDLGRDLSSHLHLHLQEFLKPQTWGDLAFIAVARGPGSFTSTRIGVVTARTLAQQLELPLFAISTSAAFAWRKAAQGNGEPGTLISSSDQQLPASTLIALQMPAQRGQLFTAVYQVSSDAASLTQIMPDVLMTLEKWQQVLAALEMPYQLVEVPADLGISATSLLELAYLDWRQGKRPHWSETLPFYGQHPVAINS
ncbi:tRNA (adenosine(37)-N6)-threonylcarbamoyltransferase complex dimerization subunit type 1 TsaB [Lyngbya aestuarii]|uniref:tRNA (adenosine(37)-N6)-threonylcarbamoyltransferase complex dimerization subunit type 1 TsaB n=1 Tax=Lyngbya aestuarii TaxID=118322 RepID=UPI00403DC4B7